MTTKRKVKPAVLIENDPKRLSPPMEDLLSEFAESVLDGLQDEGYIAPRMADDDNIGTDLRQCVHDALRRCVRG